MHGFSQFVSLRMRFVLAVSPLNEYTRTQLTLDSTFICRRALVAAIIVSACALLSILIFCGSRGENEEYERERECVCVRKCFIYTLLFGQPNGVEWFFEPGVRILATLSLTYLNVDKQRE